MGKAYFNRQTGNFEKYHKGTRLVWLGKYWVRWGDLNSENGNIYARYWDPAFRSWYYRKGIHIRNAWKASRVSAQPIPVRSTSPAIGAYNRKSHRSVAGQIISFAFTMIAVLVLLTIAYYLFPYFSPFISNLYKAASAGLSSTHSVGLDITAVSTAATTILANAANATAPNTVELITNADPANFSADIGGSGYYKIGRNVTLSIYGHYNATQYAFTGWSCTGNGCYQGPVPDPTIMINNTITETAHFESIGNSPTTTAFVNSSEGTGASLQFGSSWATQFFDNVSSVRGSTYNYCPSLSQFAQIRFNTQISNYGISHYGVQQDDQQYGIYGAEEVLFPSGSPSSYASQLRLDDPAHWQLLIDNSYTYYGYYIGSGPDIESYCNPGPEIPGPNINISQYLESQGCTPVTVTSTYFIVELDNVCPSQLT